MRAGHRVYENSGCPSCHSAFLRNNISDLARFLPENYNQVNVSREAYQQRFNTANLDFFTRRIGPDLEYTSDALNNFDFMIDYIKNPRRYNNESIMPGFSDLFNQKLTRDEISFAVGRNKSQSALNLYTRGDVLIYYIKQSSLEFQSR